MKDLQREKRCDSGALNRSWEKIAWMGGIAAAAFFIINCILLVVSSARLNEDGRLREQMAQVKRVKEIVINMGKPGNDVLENNDVLSEALNFKGHHENLLSAWSNFKKSIDAHDELAVHFDELEEVVLNLRREAGSVFEALNLRDKRSLSGAPHSEVREYEKKAAASMSRMDRQTNAAVALLEEMSEHIQMKEYEIGGLMRKFFYWSCLVATLSLVSVFIGFFLLKRLGLAHHRAIVLKNYVSCTIASIPSGILMVSEDLIVVSSNVAFRKMFGGGDVMLKGKTLETVLPLENLHKRAQGVLSSGEAQKDSTEKLSRRADWMNEVVEEKWIQVSIVPVQSVGGEDQGRLLLTVGDVGEQKKVEMRTHTILKNAQDGIVVFDGQGLIVWVNLAAERMFGMSRKELSHRTFISLIQEDHHENCHEIIASISRSIDMERPLKSCRLQAVRRNGTPFPVKMVVSGFEEDNKWIFTAFFRDKTEELMAKEAINSAYEELDLKQQQLVQSEKMASIGQLAAGVAHEINNPVGYVKSNLGRMKEYCAYLFKLIRLNNSLLVVLEEGNSSGVQAKVKEIRDMAKAVEVDFIMEDLPALLAESEEGTLRVQTIVKNLKEFSHADQEEQAVSNLNEGIESTLKIVWNELKYDVKIIKVFGEDLNVSCNQNQINQVIMNLLVNAGHAIKEKKAMSSGTERTSPPYEKGKIWIRTYFKGPWAVVEVEDNGTGISPTGIKKLFDPFYTTKPLGKGTGLGLSISYGIVQKHKGRLEVESEQGEGSKFSLLLPIVSTPIRDNPEVVPGEDEKVKPMHEEIELTEDGHHA